jgi:hypothetical protein
MSKADGYAVVLDDKGSPYGYWFVGAWNTQESAEIALKGQKGNGRIVPLYFRPEEADITPKVQDLVFAARRVWKKYGHDEVGIESDWTEWVDLRDALDAISPMNVCGQAETPSQEEK